MPEIDSLFTTVENTEVGIEGLQVSFGFRFFGPRLQISLPLILRVSFEAVFPSPTRCVLPRHVLSPFHCVPRLPPIPPSIARITFRLLASPPPYIRAGHRGFSYPRFVPFPCSVSLLSSKFRALVYSLFPVLYLFAFDVPSPLSLVLCVFWSMAPTPSTDLSFPSSTQKSAK